jgi:hypothetical protein
MIIIPPTFYELLAFIDGVGTVLFIQWLKRKIKGD